jgi:hypothetical protein
MLVDYPKAFIAYNLEMKKMRCDRCACEELVEVHGHFQCANCACIVAGGDCCQGENTFHSPPSDPADSINDEDIPN